MNRTTSFVAALPQLDIHTLSEDWALARSLEEVWLLLAESMGKPPSHWLDGAGERMYGAVLALTTWFDLEAPVKEDDLVTIDTELVSIRKPHALGLVRFSVAGQRKAEVRLLTSFIKRVQKGSNKKFSKVRDVWTAEDVSPEALDAWLERHHAMKAGALADAPLIRRYEVNRIQDFNTADFLYFKNFVRIAKAAEWAENRGAAPRLNAERDCFYFGNVEDGEEMLARVTRTGDALTTQLEDVSGGLLFLSLATAPKVTIAPR